MCINYFYFDFNEDVMGGESEIIFNVKEILHETVTMIIKHLLFQAQTMILISINS